MKIFITGTDTNVGKTIVSSWLCLHSCYSYFKPIQTGTIDIKDTDTVRQLTKDTNIYRTVYDFKEPLSPHLAAKYENRVIDINKINLPPDNTIIEGAGGLMVPINNDHYMIDLISFFDIPVILVCKTTLGTINHTLLSINALKGKNIRLLGVIMSGDINKNNRESIAFYGKVKILAELPLLNTINYNTLKTIKLTKELQSIL